MEFARDSCIIAAVYICIRGRGCTEQEQTLRKRQCHHRDDLLVARPLLRIDYRELSTIHFGKCVGKHAATATAERNRRRSDGALDTPVSRLYAARGAISDGCSARGVSRSYRSPDFAVHRVLNQLHLMRESVGQGGGGGEGGGGSKRFDPGKSFARVRARVAARIIAAVLSNARGTITLLN